ncbi:MAG: Crp/Fnr family transcriptional regulator [Burkholderiaceae bacterium]
MKTKMHGGHSNENGLLTLARERATLHDSELELSCGPRGVVAELVPNTNQIDAAPGEPIEVRVSLHPFLAGLNHHHLMLLTDCAGVTHFKKGEVILKEGDHADCFYLLETGRVVLEAITEEQKHVLVETISAGELLGWSWMFPPYVWHFTARAVEPTDALVFSGPVLREYCEKVHSLGYELFKRMSAVMTRRLQSARLKMLAAAASGCGGRCKH